MHGMGRILGIFVFVCAWSVSIVVGWTTAD